jgi:hypothetical protein
LTVDLLQHLTGTPAQSDEEDSFLVQLRKLPNTLYISVPL